MLVFYHHEFRQTTSFEYLHSRNFSDISFVGGKHPPKTEDYRRRGVIRSSDHIMKISMFTFIEVYGLLQLLLHTENKRVFLQMVLSFGCQQFYGFLFSWNQQILPQPTAKIEEYCTKDFVTAYYSKIKLSFTSRYW